MAAIISLPVLETALVACTPASPVMPSVTPPASGQNTPQIISLKNQNLSAQFTPLFGGRLTHFSVPGYESVVKFNHTLAQQHPEPEISIGSGEPPYLGHSVWLSPQNEWWNQQELEITQRGQEWPPDPFLTLQPTDPIVTQTELTLSGRASPVSGVTITQTYTLQAAGCLRVMASVKNIRQTPVEWGVWFNTRVHPEANIVAPVQTADHARYGKNFSSDYMSPELVFENGLAVVNAEITDAHTKGRRGKILMDPDAGWMAAFVKDQLFVIGFDLLPKEGIHPEQGQIEFYFDQTPSNITASFIEMESHAAMKKLDAGETMRAVQYWTVRAYPDTQQPKDLMDSIKVNLDQIQNCKRNAQ